MARRSIKTPTISGQADIIRYLFTGLREGFTIALFAGALFLLLALLSYHTTDPGWSHLTTSKQIGNAAGRAGAWIADLLLYVCGYFAYPIPLMLTYSAWLLFHNRLVFKLEHIKYLTLHIVIWILRLVGFILIIACGAGLISLQNQQIDQQRLFHPGGILGIFISQSMQNIFNIGGSCVLLFALLLIGITLFTGFSWEKCCEKIGESVIFIYQKIMLKLSSLFNKPPEKQKAPVSRRKVEPKLDSNEGKIKEPKIEIIKTKLIAEPAELPKDTFIPRYQSHSSNKIPDITLLDSYENKKKYKMSPTELNVLARQVETHLADFGVTVQVVDVHPGPVVTRFELQLAAGTKVSKISNLSKDLARSLSVISVRVVEVIPGKSVIGIELPNKDREIVGLQEVLASKAYANSRSALSLALGKDIAGHPVVVDLAKMPHLLVAGTTGAGKSVSLKCDVTESSL